MAFNITGGISLNNTIPRMPPNAPTMVAFTQDTKTSGRLTWEHMASVLTPHSGFRIETKLSRLPDEDANWEVFATAPPTPMAGMTSFTLDIDILTQYNQAQDFRVIATASSVGSADFSLDSDPSNIATFTPSTLDPPMPVTLSGATASLDTCLISWVHNPNFRCVSHYELECQEAATFADLQDGDDWRLIGTVAAQPLVNQDVSYDFIQNGYALEDGLIWYRVRAVTVDGTESDYSTVPETPQFSPVAPNIITKFGFVRTGVDSGEFSWAYDDMVPIRSFIIEAREVPESGAAGGDYTAVATVDANTPTTTRDYPDGMGGTVPCEIRTYVTLGHSAEANSLEYRMRTIGLNGQPADAPTNPITVDPVAPNPPSSFSGVVNVGQGVNTSVTLAWTPAVPTFTNISQIVLEFRQGVDSEFMQVGVYSPDENGAEVLPPSQGFVQYRLRSLGENTLLSPLTDENGNAISPVISLTVTSGSATDDSIFNGDAAFIAQQHFSVNDDDICMFDSPTRGEMVTVIEGGTYTPPTRSGQGTPADPFVYTTGHVTGMIDAPLIIDWTFQVPGFFVERRRHVYLNLDLFTRQVPGEDNPNPFRSVGGNPTTTWGVDMGTVFIEVESDPSDGAQMYLTGFADRVYADTMWTSQIGPDAGTTYTQPVGNDSNTRSFSDRQQGSNSFMFSTRTQLHLNMRRTFTFRGSGLVTLRMTFTADSSGYPIVPVFHEDLDRPGFSTDDNIPFKLCLDAWSSSIDESQSLTLQVDPGTGALASQMITFTNGYEAPPMITATADGPCVAWITDKQTGDDGLYRTAVVNAAPIAGQPAGPCNIDLTIRGY